MWPEGLSVVRGQDWKSLPVPALGSWQPRLRVCVVLPARDCQEELDRTLASLSQQSYPADLLEVVVVDDASVPALCLPRQRPDPTQLVRLDDPPSHGSGRARHVGAHQTDADVLLFLDADMVADRRHVEAHARWHHLTPHAVVLGRKWFVDFTGITAADVHEAVGAGDPKTLLVGRGPRRHVWQEDFIAARDDLTQDRDDSFLAVVGASVSLRRDLYLRAGGFSPFALRGIVDTEFGYRAFTSGGLIIPDHEARAYHQGTRSFSHSGEDIKRQRTGLAANFLPTELFRLSDGGRQWAVPMANVIVDTQGATAEDVQMTIDSVLASDFTDLVVTVVEGSDAHMPSWLSDYFSHDGRVRFNDAPPGSGYPSPLSCAVSAGLVLRKDTVRRAVALLGEHNLGVIRTDPQECGGRGMEVWKTRVLLRAAGSGIDGHDERAARLGGGLWASAVELGVAQGRVRVTRQGMLVGEAVDPAAESR